MESREIPEDRGYPSCIQTHPQEYVARNNLESVSDRENE
jgi:hypothetical protein